jgi:hypothetical protein
MARETQTPEQILAELSRLGEIAAGILDGEEVLRIITDEAMHHIAHPHPEHRFLSGDHYDVDHGLFLRAKKLLLRIARLSPLEVTASLWVPVPGGEAVTVAVHNGTHHRYYTFGQMKLPTPPDMQGVFATGQMRQVGPADGEALATVLAPIRDSLGDVVAIAELTAATGGSSPAWS